MAIADAKDWRNRDVEDWNTLSFTEYLKDKHKEVFGITYAPMRGWRFEQGQLGRAIGTNTKDGDYSKHVIKRFIDVAFDEYSPSIKYPGTNFGFIYSYRKNLLQRVEAEEVTDKRKEERKVAQDNVDLTELNDWL